MKMADVFGMLKLFGFDHDEVADRLNAATTKTEARNFFEGIKMEVANIWATMPDKVRDREEMFTAYHKLMGLELTSYNPPVSKPKPRHPGLEMFDRIFGGSP